MGAVAKGFGIAVLALAQVGGLGFFGLEDKRFEGRVGRVTSVTEGLFLGMAAGTPSVSLSGF